MTIHTFTFNPFATNCYVCHDGDDAVVVDPSCHTRAEVDTVLRCVEDSGAAATEILLTHAHIDHILGCSALAEALGVGVRMHREDLPLLQAAPVQAQMFGVPIPPPPEPSGFLVEGEQVAFGSTRWEVLHTPGHSPGSVCFLDRAAGLVISGDVLFSGSIGRTDLPGGSLPELMRSIYQVLLPLGEAMRVLPGHGPETTIGRERTTNPFLQEAV